jgi:hypothetical protein
MHPYARRAFSSSWCRLASERRVRGLSPSTPPASSVVAPMDSVGRARIYHIFAAQHIVSMHKRQACTADLLNIIPRAAFLYVIQKKSQCVTYITLDRKLVC